MAIEAISYANGSPNSPYFGRVELQFLADEQFTASYQHRTLKREWHGRLAPGTFAKACNALASTGFPNVPPLFGTQYRATSIVSPSRKSIPFSRLIVRHHEERSLQRCQQFAHSADPFQHRFPRRRPARCATHPDKS